MTDPTISSHLADLDRDTTLSLYRTMQTIRQTEEQLARYHQRGLVLGACHTLCGPGSDCQRRLRSSYG